MFPTCMVLLAGFAAENGIVVPGDFLPQNRLGEVCWDCWDAQWGHGART